MIRALLIDDDRRLPELLSPLFMQHGIELHNASSGLAGLSLLEADLFDIVLLDVMMPGQDGFETLRRIRASTASASSANVPVIMLTARGDDMDPVVGLEMGADDYVPKPFSSRVLVARIRALLRRASDRSDDSSVLAAAGIRLSRASRQCQVDGVDVALTSLEFDLLAALVQRKGRIVPRSALFAAAGRGDVTVGDRTVDVHISRIRKKIGDDPKDPLRIQTVRGAGYVLLDEAEALGPKA